MEHKITHFMYVPFTGLGLYGGFRGNRWLKNRITIFKKFVCTSLLKQTNKNFKVWVSWRPQERGHKYVVELESWMREQGLDTIFTYGGLCFWDDKFDDEKTNHREARERLATSLQYSLRDLIDVVGGSKYVLMTIQPSDDCYAIWAVDKIQEFFRENKSYQAGGFINGYIMDYNTKKMAEYNPNTNPPFYTIKFPKEDFCDPLKHMNFTALKQDVGKYKKGTPIPSHEYPPYALKYAPWDARGFMVGCHGENISTYYNHPFKGEDVTEKDAIFGIDTVPACPINKGWRRRLFHSLPYRWQRKIRYVLGEKFYARIYKLILS